MIFIICRTIHFFSNTCKLLPIKFCQCFLSNSEENNISSVIPDIKMCKWILKRTPQIIVLFTSEISHKHIKIFTERKKDVPCVIP